ncbi:maleylpyruvate isomerase N-terminal domain-containing protein [Micromonospora sp. NBC_01796]|uniref:maleylpyruvate isomerase N-terminal domain-containing protein n=1 Tax=Micromonospora sp. NBC_01796 TaxID=2975987 RepID=UPI002DDB499D|nr:maleylpyruvate isomerase N-terminal domain-containing protein [Micromonospora sp. NBC_01796]WSA83998.1 maleylpyruvate isomerase N-terminal domain-containing protein [Micromonospora sp. NBC_01796]
MTFSEQLRLIDERSTAFRAAVAAAPSLDMQVPTHPERTLFDLVRHVGMGRRKAAAVVAAGPADGPPEKSVWEGGAGAPRERDALLAWWTESIEQLASVLREAGPERDCWTWWGDSQSPQTSGSWARRQIHEIAVYTYDAQLTVGVPQPLPEEVALDGFDDCQFTLCSTTVAWPHEPAVVEYHASEGHSWRLRLSQDGARAARLPRPDAGEGPDAPDASAQGTASDLVLVFYNRIPLDSLKLKGDRRIFDQLIAWDPSV